MSTFLNESPCIGGPKFHRTAAGDLPLDWTAQALGAHVRITSGESPSKFRFQGSGTPFFKVDQLNSDSKYLATTPYFFAGPESVPAGSVVFPKRGASILLNKIRIFAADSYMDTNLMALTPISRIDSEFLYYTLEHIQLWRFADTASIPQINNKHVKPLPIPFPGEEEQRAIAAVLANVDSLLGKIDALLAKKRDLKQAAMQQLLGGRRRLSGSQGKWCTRSFDEVLIRVNAKPHQLQATEYLPTGDHPVVDQGQRLIAGFCDRDDLVLKCPPHGVIVFGDHTCIVKYVNFDFVVGADGTQVLFPRKGNSARFLAFYLQYHELAQSGYNRHFKLLRQVSFHVPTESEQNAIAGVLAAMDDELTFLEARREKAFALKQGMMQQLLTGRIRLT